MPPSLPPPQPEALVVYAPRLAPLPGEAAFDVVRLDAPVLQLAPRLDEALKLSPGLSLFRRTDSGAANPTIQGLSLRAIAPSGAGRALVTLDGAPQNDPFGGWVIWSALPPVGVASATLVRGAGAGPYGAGALTGVVALREVGAAEGLAAADSSVGSRSSYRAALAGGGPGVLVTVSGESTAGYVPVRGPRAGAADRPTDLHDAAFAFRAQGRVGEAAAALRLSAYEERRGAGLAGAGSIASGAAATLTLARQAAEGDLGWRLQAWARASDLANRSVAVAADRASTTPANDQYATPARGLGLNAAIQDRWGGVSWELGLDGRLARGRARERFRFINGRFTRRREAGGQTTVAGVYAEASLERGPWIATGGARLDAWASSRAARREWDLDTGRPTLDESAPDASGATPTARAGVRYGFSNGTFARAASYIGFRPPTLNELHRPFRVGNDVTEANAGLEPETLQGVELGAGGEGLVSWSTTLFYNRLKDPITNVTVGLGPGSFPTAGFIPAGGVLRQRRNAGAIAAWGLEAEAGGELPAALAWRSALAFTHARVRGGEPAPQLSGKRPSQTPQFTWTAGLDWRPAERLTLTGRLRYESLRYEDDLNTRKLAPGAQLDARAAWRLGGGAEIYLAAENLADARLEVGETADGVESFAAPRTLRLGFASRL